MQSTRFVPIAPTVTGHPEIDAQHDRLLALTTKLGSVCAKPDQAGNPCAMCLEESRLECTNRLADLIGALLGFMMEHFSYEEALMRQLPPSCRKHVEAHQLAHAEISHRLSDLTKGLDRDNPHHCSLSLQHIIEAWMGNHTIHLDGPLTAELKKAYVKEIGFDVELAGLLDTHPARAR